MLCGAEKVSQYSSQYDRMKRQRPVSLSYVESTKQCFITMNFANVNQTDPLVLMRLLRKKLPVTSLQQPKTVFAHLFTLYVEYNVEGYSVL